MRDRKKALLLALKLISGVALLATIIVQVDKDAVGRALASVDLPLFVMSCIVMAAGVAANAVRWDAVMRSLDMPIGLKPATIGYFEAMFFNQILPTGIGGDGIRALRAIDTGVPWGWALAGIIIDRAIGMFATAAIILLAGYLLVSNVAGTPAFVICALFSMAIIGVGIATIVLSRWAKGSPRAAKFLSGKYGSKLRPVMVLVHGFASSMSDARVLPRILVSQALSSIAVILSFWLCARALDLPLCWLDAAIAVQGVALSAIIPLSIGGWGVREGATILLLANSGIGDAPATALSIVFGLVLTVLGVVGAIVWMSGSYRRLEVVEKPDVCHRM
ncbi:MAG: lysylphosphatidylglycerol synthase transmembrane domain-containing protein [Hyphomicrobium sp.]